MNWSAKMEVNLFRGLMRFISQAPPALACPILQATSCKNLLAGMQPCPQRTWHSCSASRSLRSLHTIRSRYLFTCVRHMC